MSLLNEECIMAVIRHRSGADSGELDYYIDVERLEKLDYYIDVERLEKQSTESLIEIGNILNELRWMVIDKVVEKKKK